MQGLILDHVIILVATAFGVFRIKYFFGMVDYCLSEVAVVLEPKFAQLNDRRCLLITASFPFE